MPYQLSAVPRDATNSAGRSSKKLCVTGHLYKAQCVFCVREQESQNRKRVRTGAVAVLPQPAQAATLGPKWLNERVAASIEGEALISADDAKEELDEYTAANRR